MSDSMIYSGTRNFMVDEEQKARRTDRKFMALKVFFT